MAFPSTREAIMERSGMTVIELVMDLRKVTSPGSTLPLLFASDQVKRTESFGSGLEGFVFGGQYVLKASSFRTLQSFAFPRAATGWITPPVSRYSIAMLAPVVP